MNLIRMTLLTTLMLLFSLGVVEAVVAPDDVDIRFTLADAAVNPDIANSVVADVPFSTMASMNTNGINILSYNLYVTSNNPLLRYSGAIRGELFPQNDLDANNGPQDGGITYRYQVKPKVGYDANAAEFRSLFTLAAQVEGLGPAVISLKTNPQTIHPDNVVTPSEAGRSAQIRQEALAVQPVLSRCGDGVVGYYDDGAAGGILNNGIKDGGEKDEACDDGNTVGSSADEKYASKKDGCSSDCRFVDIGYQCSNTQFGSRRSVCAPIPPKQLLIEKITALVGEECYPNQYHPGAFYCQEGMPQYLFDVQGTWNAGRKIYFLSQITSALQEYFEGLRRSPQRRHQD